MFDSTKELLDKIRLGEDSFLEEEPTPRITERSIAARSSAGAAYSLRAGVIDRLYRGASTGLVYGRSSTCPARNLAVRGRGGRIRGSRAPRCVRLDRAPRCRRLRGASTELLRAGF